MEELFEGVLYAVRTKATLGVSFEVWVSSAQKLPVEVRG
jgi:hypothetical protein